jgi:hypothetical protein
MLIIKSHTYHTYQILSNMSVLFQDISETASFHHEKLNGNGYPFHISSKDLSLERELSRNAYNSGIRVTHCYLHAYTVNNAKLQNIFPINDHFKNR